MRRTTIALLAALEASVAALIGLGIVLMPLLLLWAVHFGLAVDAAVFLRAAADVWLLGHGVDLMVQLDPVTAGRIAVPGAGDPFPITIALLGFALLTVASGRRIGRRSAAGGHSFTGGIAAVVVYAAAGAGLALVAAADAAHADPWQASLLPAGIVALGVVIGAVGEVLRTPGSADAATGLVRRAFAALPAGLVAGARAAVRIGAGAAFGVLAVAGVLVAVLIALDYATIAGLYQALGAGIDGGIALTVAELALLPNVVIWAAAWLLGPGFAIGTGSLVSTGGTLLGPVPGVPLLGALPADAPALGALWLIVPVLLGFAGAWAVSTGDDPDRDVPRAAGWWAPLAVAAGAAATSALVLGLLAWWSGGAAGPGRLAEVGPAPLAVAGVAAVTVGIGALVGGYAARLRRRTPDEPEWADSMAASLDR
ncbi:DUF6350 family protein [Agromyces sp. Soil535]|uniref:cell division protein PerM n=1 Tax=Agromyces sp. Soil535 TaxID=1736390 RepID=UPI0006FC98E4|nr:DUF6350 family protein [Agromyces sp. Soil535]KRE21141.1 hypothetical protein ASG80_13860 [Agromyces sp. Soil535]